MLILFQQKRAWHAFAKKKGLEYEKRALLQSPVIRGTIGGYGIYVYSDMQKTVDIRGERFVTVIEFDMGKGMPTGAALGTKEMRDFIEALSFTEPFRPDYEKWSGDYVAKTRDYEALAAYMTPGRMDALLDVFKMRNSIALFFFDEQDCVLHIETPDPLRDPQRMDRILQRILNTVKILDIKNDAVASQAGEPPAKIKTKSAKARPAKSGPAKSGAAKSPSESVKSETPSDAE